MSDSLLMALMPVHRRGEPIWSVAMRALVAVGCLAAIVMIAASATMNFLFMSSLGRTEIESYVLGTVSVAVDVLKALLAVFVAVAARRGNRSYVMIGGCAFALFSIASILSAVGFSVQNRLGVAEAAVVGGYEIADAESELKRLQERLQRLPATRAVAIVEADIKANTIDLRWMASRQCAAPTNQQQRTYCQAVARLETELATAQEMARLDERRATAQMRISTLRGRIKDLRGDAQTTLLANAFGVEATTFRVLLGSFAALIVEIASGLGLYLATGHVDGRKEAAHESVEPATAEIPEHPPAPKAPVDVRPGRPAIAVSVRSAPAPGRGKSRSAT